MEVRGMITTTVSFKPITKHARANKYKGKHIMCPKCETITKVYHFAWSALTCQCCHTDIDKSLWSIQS